MAKYKYITIDLRNIEKIKKAEKLKDNGWKIICSSLDTILMEKLKKE